MRLALLGPLARPRAVALLIVVLGGLCVYLGWERWASARQLASGKAALTSRDHTRALECLTRYLAFRPSDTDARLLAARAARGAKDFDLARHHLLRCRRESGDSDAIQVEFALIEVESGDLTAGPELRRRAEQDDELALVILEVLIQQDLDTYNMHRALEGLTRYLQSRPGDLHALLARAYVWEKFLYFADAARDYREAVAAHPTSRRARLKLAETLLITGPPKEALEQFRWLAGPGRWADRPEVRFGTARCRRQLGEVEEARRQLEGLAAEFPSHGELLLELGQLEMDDGRPVDAERWLRRAVQVMPRDRRANYSLSRCLAALGRDDAKVYADRADQIIADLAELDRVVKEVMSKPDDAGLRCKAGLLYLRNGERAEGVRWLRQALRLDPHCEEARAALVEAESRRP